MKSEQRKEIQDLVEILTEQNLTEIEIERKDLRIRVRRDVVPAVSPPTPVAPFSAERAATPHLTIEAPEIDNARLLTSRQPPRLPVPDNA